MTMSTAIPVPSTMLWEERDYEDGSGRRTKLIPIEQAWTNCDEMDAWALKPERTLDELETWLGWWKGRGFEVNKVRDTEGGHIRVLAAVAEVRALIGKRPDAE